MSSRRSSAIALVSLAAAFGAGHTVHAESLDMAWITKSLSQSAPSTEASTTVVSTPRRSRAITAIGRLPPETIDGAERTERSGRVVSDSCVPQALKRALADVEATFGAVSITSACRSRSQNEAAGGAPRSLHLSGQAVDFRVSGTPSAVQAMLTRHPDVGGLKHYGGGLFHIDTGDRRSF
jgi:hypothetical protein